MIVYRWGSLTPDNFTPRPDRDTIGRCGQEPGLSAFDAPPVGRKAQGIELDLLSPPLGAFFDEPERGGTRGHVSIAPLDPAGNVDEKALEEWAKSFKSGLVHPFTQAILDAIVQPNIRSES